MGTINDYTLYHQVKAGYQITNQDVDSGDADIYYLGFINQEGEWFIRKEDRSVSDDDDSKSWLFTKGSSDYTTNYALRESLTYANFYETFK